MKKNRSSSTAQLAALARAAQFKEGNGPDHLAERFLGPLFRMLVKSNRVMELARRVYTSKMPGTYPFLLARTLFFDEVFLSELADGAKQIVLLGAGLDSRAYRFAPACQERGARVFELDFPAMSAVKRARVEKVFGKLPAHVSYVPIDFNITSLAEPLIAAGYDPDARTLFVWEGVTFYIARAAVDAVLCFVATQSGAGSAVAFDYLDARVLEPTCDLWGAEQARRYVARKGEPFTFGIDGADVDRFLVERGLLCAQDLTPSELEHRFLTRPDGSTFGRVAGFYRLAIARLAEIPSRSDSPDASTIPS